MNIYSVYRDLLQAVKDIPMNLNCPISETKMMEPVNPQGCCTTYDRDNILKKIEGMYL
jgi:SUMO ligase MMS21 Smc5/6 complex component